MSASIFYVYEIKQCIDWIKEDTAGLTFETFRTSRQVVQLAERNLLVISEAARKLPDEVLARHPHIPWRQIKGIGNILRHDYADVMPTTLWAIVADDLDPLLTAVNAEIAALEAHEP
jgi:uncharacterized protein with HEPN domain